MLSIYNIKKWYRMLTGKSTLHVMQKLGPNFEANKVEGYFNDFSQKVLTQKNFLEKNKLPEIIIENGKKIFFPVAIFQYGLGCYDLYLKNNEEKYLQKFKECCEWAMTNQKSDGSWNNFFYIYPDHPYGAMCQGEGASLLLRMYQIDEDIKYYNASKLAIDFMLKPVSEGGTADYKNDEIIFLEYTHKPAVLNGWIFALFGLYDFVLISGEQYYQKIYNKALSTLDARAKEFDCGYWSMYDLDNHIASPFYHGLHIEQLKALLKITESKSFLELKNNFEKYQGSRLKRSRSFIKKAFQKIVER